MSSYSWFWRVQYPYLGLLLLSDLLRSVSILTLLSLHYRQSLLIWLSFIVFLRAMPPILLEPKGFRNMTLITIPWHIIQILALCIVGPICIFFVLVLLNVWVFYVHGKACIKLIHSNETIYRSITQYLLKQNSYKQCKYKIIAINYIIISYTNNSNDNINQSLIMKYEKLRNYIDDKYENNKCHEITFDQIRKHSSDIWRNQSTFLSFIAFCRYNRSFETPSQPTSVEWICYKICSICDTISAVMLQLTVPIWIVIIGIAFMNEWYLIFIFVWFIMDVIIAKLVIFKYIYPFYYCLSHLLPFLENRHSMAEIVENLDDNGVVWDMIQKEMELGYVYDALMLDDIICDIIYEHVEPQSIAQTLLGFIRPSNLSELIFDSETANIA